MILVVKERYISEIMALVAGVAQQLTQTDGARAPLKTLDDASLRSAALVALQIACAQPVVSESERIRMPSDPELRGIIVRAG